ncbi:sigma-B regulation protein RsbU (phosphoserine phosphatase) [Prauserella shujinwangii]|uniref:Sigma-B regulation protein RsbU (Phosphoserine phosphatase) n=1 Tax=Prauserella shujinwangii TaxID=1453103 RepID=A0A2T0M1K1_9PSEU|nr:GAF domain-containing SpoIIE family protein phosphatase [Prauserella shujinwangii]PRX50447.1 sigma-B regulation protein RsbU (phosphoserine phosphatase) [Prauserella shujinwangii]
MTTTTASAETVERARLAAVDRYDILDTPPDGAFDRIAAMAARLLDAPIATVSIVDSDRIWFKATHGLSGVTQVGRDPGLCASAVLQDAPYVVADALTDPRTMRNPLVRGELGIRFYAAAPIVTSEGHRLGTVNVLDTRPRELDPAGAAILRDLAAVVMDELELRLSALTTLREERRLRERAQRDAETIESFATTLRSTLLPPRLPDVPGLELACHYHAASARHVTGDFYDVFALGDGRWGVFVGDVTGHGAAAAAVTSLTRYTLRAAALHHPDPTAGLAELNTALLMDRHVSEFCTVLFGVLTPGRDGGFDVTLASGGHPPALRLGDGAVREVHPEGGMLVGALPDARFAACQTRLEPGESLLLYTDGLTEARPGGTFFGEDGLTAFLDSRGHGGAQQLVDDLTDLIAGFDPAPTDDVALLAMSVPA